MPWPRVSRGWRRRWADRQAGLRLQRLAVPPRIAPARPRRGGLYEQYGEKPRIAALHAGLECGILSGKLPELDCISLGPDLTDIHTPRERLHIASTERTWRLLLGTLKRLDA